MEIPYDTLNILRILLNNNENDQGIQIYTACSTIYNSDRVTRRMEHVAYIFHGTVQYGNFLHFAI